MQAVQTPTAETSFEFLAAFTRSHRDQGARPSRNDQPSHTAGRRRTRVLLVDDDRDIPPFVEHLLDDAADGEYALTWTDSYAEAVRLLKDSPPDVALIDYRLGNRTGLELLAEVSGLTPAPLILFTGDGDRDTDRVALRLGASDYLEKHALTAEGLERTIRYAVERRRSADALKTSEERFRALIETSTEGLVLLGADGRITFHSPGSFNILGYAPGETIGRDLKDLVPLDQWASFAAVFGEALSRPGVPISCGLEARHRDGTSRELQCTIINRLHEPAVRAVVWNYRDVTEHSRAERTLRDTEAKFSLLFRSSPAAIYVADLETGQIIEANPRFAELTGFRLEEAVGRSTIELNFWVDVNARHRLVTRLVEGHAVRNVDTKVRRRSGEVRDVLVSFETVVYEKTGRQVLIGLLTDITDVRLLEENFRQAQKMEALGRLAGGVAHDFNNLLLAIIGYADLVLSLPDLPDRVTRSVTQIGNAGRRAETLTRQLLAFSRRTILEPRILDLNLVVGNMQSLLRRLLGEDVTLETQLTHGLSHVHADAGQIDQIVMNLAVNARDAMPRGGCLRIETANVLLDEAYVDAHPGASTGPHVMLSVSDTGIGMDDAIKARLFEPFFTTKPQGKGTGLGLATVYGAVKQNGGSIWVYSEPGLGCTFKVFLPAVDQPVALEAPPTRVTPLGGRETIVLVEDHEHAREFAREVLARHGYTVQTASDPKEALDLMSRLGQDVSLLLTDVVMPQMNGRDLAKLCVERLPHVRVLYMSGYTTDAIVSRGFVVEGIAWIQKPFVALDLLNKVRTVLDAAHPPAV